MFRIYLSFRVLYWQKYPSLEEDWTKENKQLTSLINKVVLDFVETTGLVYKATLKWKINDYISISYWVLVVLWRLVCPAIWELSFLLGKFGGALQNRKNFGNDLKSIKLTFSKAIDKTFRDSDSKVDWNR